MSVKPPTSNPHNAGQATNHAGQAMNRAGLFQTNKAADRLEAVKEAVKAAVEAAVQTKAGPKTP
jgi:hypothetical protein